MRASFCMKMCHFTRRGPQVQALIAYHTSQHQELRPSMCPAAPSDIRDQFVYGAAAQFMRLAGEGQLSGAD